MSFQLSYILLSREQYTFIIISNINEEEPQQPSARRRFSDGSKKDVDMEKAILCYFYMYSCIFNKLR